MQPFFDEIKDRNGRAIRGATVTVLNASGELATIYSDNGTTVAANPISANADGEVSFYAPNGRYTLTYAAPGTVGESREWVPYDRYDDLAPFAMLQPSGVDDTLALQAAASAAYVAGGGEIRLAPGVFRSAQPLPLLSGVTWRGVGAKASQLLTSASVAFQQAAGTQLVAGGVRDLYIKANAAGSSATGLLITAAQDCVFEQLVFENFDNGRIIDIAGALATTWDADNIWPRRTSNVIFNKFSHITAYGCAVGLSIMGHFGGTPTASPANSAPVPDLVVTQNRYEHLVFYQVAQKGIDIVGACDTEQFDEVLINLGTNGAIGVDIASHPTYTGNSYVNSNGFDGLVFSRQPGVTSGTLIRMGWTFGQVMRVEHDLGTASGLTFLDAGNSLSHKIVTKSSGAASPSNLVIETIEKNVFHGIDDGFSTAPALAFANDRDTGMFRGSAGEFVLGHSGKAMVTIKSDVVSLGGDTSTAALRALPVAGNLNGVQAYGTAAGAGFAKIGPFGADANLDLVLEPKGSGKLQFTARQANADGTLTDPQYTFTSDLTAGVFRGTGGEWCVGHTGKTMVAVKSDVVALGGDVTTAAFRALPAANNMNAVQAYGTAAGGGIVKLAPVGSDTNIDLVLEGKGAGAVRFGTHATNADAPITGYITIKDSTGATRKLAVIS